MSRFDVQTINLSSGQTTSNITLNSGDQETIFSGGVAYATTVFNGGLEFISAGGLASGTVVSNGGFMDVSGGGTTSGAFLVSGGFASVSSGGVAVDTTVQGVGQNVDRAPSSSELDIGFGAIASNTAVGGGGLLNVNGSAAFVFVFSGGQVNVASGGTATDQTISGLSFLSDSLQRSSETVQSGGDIFNTSVTYGAAISLQDSIAATLFILSGATVDVSQGGVTSNTLIQGLGPSGDGSTPAFENVSSGSVAESTSVGSGGDLNIAGGFATDVFVFSGGEFFVQSGGSATNVTVSGLAGSDGPFSFATISGGGFASGVSATGGGVVNVQGEADSLSVISGGTLNVVDDGVTSDVTLSGTIFIQGLGTFESFENVSGGGFASNTTVGSGGVLDVQGGTAQTVSVGAGGFFSVSSDGFAQDVTLDGSSGGPSAFATISSGGQVNTLVVDDNASAVVGFAEADNITVNDGGFLELDSGGFASNVTVSSGGTILINGGFVEGLTLLSGAREIFYRVVSGDGTVSGVVVSNGDILTVRSGGAAISTTVLSGGELIYGGGSVVSAKVRAGGREDIEAGVTVSNLQLGLDVFLVVESGGTAFNVVANKGGELIFGSAKGGRLVSGGFQIVSGGGVASGVTISGIGQNQRGGKNALQSLLDGGESIGTVVGSGGIQIVGPGSVASRTTVLSGGLIELEGGVATGLIVSGGAKALVTAGSTLSGLVISRGTILTVSSGGVANKATVLKGGEIIYAGGIVSAPTFSAGSIAAVAPGGQVSGLIASAGVTLLVSSGGTASGTILRGGAEIVSAGGKIVGTVTMSGGSDLSVAANTGVALTISGFGVGDTLRLARFAAGANEKLSFKENTAKTQGTLTITDGKLKATAVLFGQYVAAGFHAATDGAVGSVITYSTASSGQVGELAGKG